MFGMCGIDGRGRVKGPDVGRGGADQSGPPEELTWGPSARGLPDRSRAGHSVCMAFPSGRLDSAAAEVRAMTFQEFYTQAYLERHADWRCRLLHVLGLPASAAYVVVVVWLEVWWLLV